jgi:hypothetical protein
VSLIDDFTPASAIESRAPLADRAQYALVDLDAACRRMWGDEAGWTGSQRQFYERASAEVFADYEAAATPEVRHG